jgi:hypothetical protein
VTMRIDPSVERSIIITRPEKRPYGAKLIFQVLNKGFLGNLEHVTIFLDDGASVTLAPERQLSWEGGRRLSLTLEGFPTASQAEEHGRRLVQGLLWTSENLGTFMQSVLDIRNTFTRGISGKSSSLLLTLTHFDREDSPWGSGINK